MTPIAIIGIGCRFPGAHGPAAFWRLLNEGREAVSIVPPDRWDADAHFDPEPAAVGRMSSRWGAFVPDIDRFDAGFFGISAEEARAMDPQQRLMLEVAWETLEDAGVAPQALAGSNTGVFVGLSSLNYGTLSLLRPEGIGPYSNAGASGSIAANRISYFLDLRGPSFSVDAACASSLLAVHLACQSLHTGECAAALVGGVNAVLMPGPSVGVSKNGAMPADGHCRVFDAAAAGCVRGEGAGAVLLKPLPKALADGDPIYGVINGTAVGQNGRSNGLTGPNRFAQEAVLREAYRSAGVSPGSVQYVETHSTGTPVGDATELAALGAVLKEGRAANEPCAVGSLKTNIGHLEAAAGVAGLIKVALMLKHLRLVPTLHYQNPSPYAQPDKLGLCVQTQAQPWSGKPQSRIAGISAAGYGGANVHVVLGEQPAASAQPDTGDDSAPHLLTLSAKCAKALTNLATRYLRWLDDNTHVSLRDLCFTANSGRYAGACRLALVTSDFAQLRQQLRTFVAGEAASGSFSGEVVRAARSKSPPSGGASSEQHAPSDELSKWASAWVAGGNAGALPRATRGRRVHGLPTYPFQRERYWIDADPSAPAPAPAQKKPAAASHADAPFNPDADEPDAAAPARHSTEPIVMPRNEVERGLVRIWEEMLKVSPIGVRDSFFELGGKSATALQVFARIETEFHKVLPLSAFYSAATIEQLAELLQSPVSTKTWATVVKLNPKGTRPPVFFIPGLGGHAFNMLPFAARLGEDQPFYVLHPQGLNPDEVPLTSVQDIARAFLPRIREIQPQGPYRIAGYSFGGTIAFEMACQLREAGDSVALLALLDAQTPDALPKRSLASRLLTHVRLLFTFDAQRRRENWAESVNWFWKRLHYAALGKENVESVSRSEVVDAVKRVADANRLAWRTYVPRHYPGRAVLFRASELKSRTELFCNPDPTNGWGRYVDGGLEVIELPTGHLKVLKGESVEFMAEQMRRVLATGNGGEDQAESGLKDSQPAKVSHATSVTSA